MPYRHYSFDVWLTLIRSNPAFRHARTEYFARHFNPLGHAPATVDKLVKEVDVTCTRVNELVGRNIDSQELFLLMANQLGTNLAQLTSVQLAQAQQDLDDLFRAHPPHLTDDALPVVLTELRARGATLSLLSNTGLMRGAALRQFFKRAGIGDLFSFQLYSDEVTLSKPNPAFYALLFQQARQLPEHTSAALTPTDIIHLGDNPVADVAGATAAGLNARLIDPERPNFADLLT